MSIVLKDCKTCGNRKGSKCIFTGFSCELERRYPSICGENFEHGWIPRPLSLTEKMLKGIGIGLKKVFIIEEDNDKR